MSKIIENAVTVGELKDFLADYPDKAHVILASDADGSSYTVLEYVEGGQYESSSRVHGDFTPTDDEEDAVCLIPFEN